MIRIFPQLFDQGRTWKNAQIPNKEFIERYSFDLKNLVIGCSFSPEHIEFLSKSKIDKKNLPLECLKVIVEIFKIKDIRLGIRWNSVDNDGTLNLSYYKPFLDYCFKNKVRVTLNVGPIKTFRWPEQFVPDYILKQIVLPDTGSEILPKSQLAIEAKAYLNNLYKALLKEFSVKELSQLTIIQIENEPFHRFGKYEWRMSEDYIKELYDLTLMYFPSTSFLINSSENRNVAKIAKFYKKLIEKNKSLKDRLIIGYNFFYNVPKVRTLPLLGKFDSITLTNLSFKKLCQKNIFWADEVGYNIEVTEAQTEPWLPIVTPGNNAQEFRFLLLRSAHHLLDCRKKSLMRIWGIEHLSLAYKKSRITSEHKQIIELIQRVNT